MIDATDEQIISILIFVLSDVPAKVLCWRLSREDASVCLLMQASKYFEDDFERVSDNASGEAFEARGEMARR